MAPTSMSSGLMSTMLKVVEVFCKFHKFIRKSSAERYVSPSGLNDKELMWYVCPLEKVRFKLAVAID